MYVGGRRPQQRRHAMGHSAGINVSGERQGMRIRKPIIGTTINNITILDAMVINTKDAIIMVLTIQARVMTILF